MWSWEKKHFFWKKTKSRDKLKTRMHPLSSLLEIFSVGQKIPTSRSAYFFNARRRCSSYQILATSQCSTSVHVHPIAWRFLLSLTLPLLLWLTIYVHCERENSRVAYCNQYGLILAINTAYFGMSRNSFYIAVNEIQERGTLELMQH